MFDIETEGLDPYKHKIITIQYQQVNNSGMPIGELVILREWEEGEKTIVEKAHKLLVQGKTFDFIPIGTNLMFDLRFLFTKFRKYELPLGKSEVDFLYDKPKIDIHSSLVIINKLQFKGSGLTDMTGKEKRGDYIVEMYEKKEFGKIIEYIIDETNAFLKALQSLCKEMPSLREKLK